MRNSYKYLNYLLYSNLWNVKILYKIVKALFKTFNNLCVPFITENTDRGKSGTFLCYFQMQDISVVALSVAKT